jgi:hypothetical protein
MLNEHRAASARSGKKSDAFGRRAWFFAGLPTSVLTLTHCASKKWDFTRPRGGGILQSVKQSDINQLSPANILKQFAAPPCNAMKEKMDDCVDGGSETVLHRAARRTWHAMPAVAGRP